MKIAKHRTGLRLNIEKRSAGTAGCLASVLLKAY
jgi:hypothetical protein